MLNQQPRTPAGRGASSSSALPSSLDLSDTKVHEPEMRTRLGTAAHLCRVGVLKLRALLQTLESWFKRGGIMCMGYEMYCNLAQVLPLPFSFFFITLEPKVE